MKAFLYDIKGAKKETKAPAFFDSIVREEVVAKAVEAERQENRTPYGLFKEAGKRHSASGTISHKRHEWKGHYGKGIARVPRKTMWRRGTQFMWIATEVNMARGGRRVHGPTIFKKAKKINSKEMKLALRSALAATAQQEFIERRYSTFKGFSGVHIIEKMPEKTNDLVELTKKIFNSDVSVPQSKSVRAGIGKRRGRQKKQNAGALIIVGEKEKSNLKHLDVRTAKDVSVVDLYPLGRLTIFTEKAMEELKNAI